jgi:hypothetical protein
VSHGVIHEIAINSHKSIRSRVLFLPSRGMFLKRDGGKVLIPRIRTAVAVGALKLVQMRVFKNAVCACLIILNFVLASRISLLVLSAVA